MKVKCFVTIKGHSVSEEIRLFKVDPNSETPYDDLVAKLVDCYKNDTCVFTMSWKDEEGDEIVVSSNGEVQAALEECPGAPNATLKMNVTATVGKSKEKVWGGYANKIKSKKGKYDATRGVVVQNWENPAMTHPGVTCDGCEGPVMGPRWKCSVCPDFDLCKPCKRKGIHSDHMFVKIPYRLRNWRQGRCPINIQTPIFEFELKEDSMTDKQRIELEELQVQTADMYISDNLIGAPITESACSLTTDLSNKTVPEEDQMTDTNETGAVVPDFVEEEMVTVEDSNDKVVSSGADEETVVCPAPISDDDGIRVTGCDNGEFVLLNPNDHVDVPAETYENVSPSSVYPTLEESSATAPPDETVAALPPPLTPTRAPNPRPDSSDNRPKSAASCFTESDAAPFPPKTTPSATRRPITSLALPPHVHAALTCMLEMGYTNSGEWLAKLLHNKNGDINTVIDILNSRMSQ